MDSSPVTRFLTFLRLVDSHTAALGIYGWIGVITR